MSLVAFAIAFPVADDEEEASPKVGSNLLFQQLNEILKREITKEVKNDSLEIGDKYTANDGTFQIQIQQFSTNQGFPVFFKPHDEEVLDDKEIVALVSDFDGSSEYEIKKDDSGEVEEVKKEDSKSKVETTPKEVSESTTISSSTSSSSTITSKKSEDSESSTGKTIIAKVVESTSTQTTPSTTTNKQEKIPSEIAEKPLILTHI